MDRSRPSKYLLAQEQWRAFHRLLQDRLRVDVALIEPKSGLPDLVFTANAGFVWKKKFIASNFRHEVRRGETAYYQKWFAIRGFEIFHFPAEDHFEGEGDLLMCGDVLFAGYPFRSSIACHGRLAEIIERDILSLKLTDHWFYHLDTCFCPLTNSAAMYYPAAFDTEALNILERHIPTLIPVSEDEARRFTCNAIVVEKNVIMNHGCPRISSQLQALGFSVFEIPLSEFIKAGGSAKCLVLHVPYG
jgi:N-dimethylarginine dimethylaminohydrolase